MARIKQPLNRLQRTLEPLYIERLPTGYRVGYAQVGGILLVVLTHKLRSPDGKSVEMGKEYEPFAGPANPTEHYEYLAQHVHSHIDGLNRFLLELVREYIGLGSGLKEKAN